MSYSQHKIKCRGKTSFIPWISIAVLSISGLLVYLELKIKSSFLRIIKKTYDSTMKFGYIFINRIQPFKAANISTAFFLCKRMMKHYNCLKFFNTFLRHHLMRSCYVFSNVRLVAHLKQ